MNKNYTAADKVYNMLGFQYKPLEAKILKALKKLNKQNEIDWYKNLPTTKKIIVLDRMAALMGL